MKNLLLFTLIGLSLLACEREDSVLDTNEKGEITSLKPIWSFPLHEQEPSSNSIVDAHLVLDQKILLATTNGTDNRALTCVDVSTGEALWKWQDIFAPPIKEMSVRDAYIYDNTLAFNWGGHHYAINMENGQTKWRNAHENSFQRRISGIGNTYFIHGAPTDTLEEFRVDVLYQGDLNTGMISHRLTPYFSQEYIAPGNRIGNVTGTYPFEEEGAIYAAIIYQESPGEYDWVSYLGLYNLSTDKWIYERIPINEPEQSGVLFHKPILKDQRLYCIISSTIYCMDLKTGGQLWSYYVPGDLSFGGMIVEEGKVIANGGNKVLYALDAENGNLIWRAEGAGTSSFLEGRYLDGVVYFSGGSSSRIHAVSIKNGKTLWRLDPSQVEEGSQDWKPDLYVIPGANGTKGRIVASTHQNAYCFEAASVE
ncbi:MAG: PQQ-like beta-propeller repeat protein [Bacteroidia bacterium]|nr:PQQ-like beta-propeller repeat protein [Bacteroidia bacterium]